MSIFPSTLTYAIFSHRISLLSTETEQRWIARRNLGSGYRSPPPSW